MGAFCRGTRLGTTIEDPDFRHVLSPVCNEKTSLGELLDIGTRLNCVSECPRKGEA